MHFQDLLRLHQIPEQEVSLCLHKPGDPVTRRALAIMAEEQPELFDAYQSTHAPLQEATVRAWPYFASFLAQASGDLAFLGLFARDIGPVMSAEAWLNDPRCREMIARADGHKMKVEDKARELAGRIWFHLKRLPVFEPVERRMICRDPGGRNYVRLAETTPIEILELRRFPRVSPPMPAWTELALTRTDLRALPRDWGETLRNWRGIYLIVDESDGARYVGSAYGADNLLGRWQHHVARDEGVARELAVRDTASFRFTILELVSPTLPADEVIAIENSWKHRLDTRRFGLNVN